MKRFFIEEERTTTAGGSDIEERWAKCAEVEQANERVRRALSYEAMREEASEAVYWSQLQSSLEGLRSTLERCGREARTLAADGRTHLLGSPTTEEREHLTPRVPWLDELALRLDTLQDVVVDRDVIDRVAQRLGAQWREVARVSRLSWMLQRVVLGGLGLAVVALLGFWAGMGRAVSEFDGELGDAKDAFVGSLEYHGRLVAVIAICGAIVALVFYKGMATARIRREVGRIGSHVGRYLGFTEIHEVNGQLRPAALPGRRDRIEGDGLRADAVRFAVAFLIVVLASLVPFALAAAREPLYVSIEGESQCVEGLPLPSTSDELVMLARAASGGGFETVSIPLRRVLMTTDEPAGCLGDPALRRPSQPALGELVRKVSVLLERKGERDDDQGRIVEEILAGLQAMAAQREPPARVDVVLPPRATAAIESIARHAASLDEQAAALAGIPAEVSGLGERLVELRADLGTLHRDLGTLGATMSRPARALVKAALVDTCTERELLMRGLWTRAVGPVTRDSRDAYVQRTRRICEGEAEAAVAALVPSLSPASGQGTERAAAPPAGGGSG